MRVHALRYPHVVLVTIDTLHVLETGVYNPEVTVTPNLVDFARNGVVFQHALHAGADHVALSHRFS